MILEKDQYLRLKDEFSQKANGFEYHEDNKQKRGPV